MKGSPMHRLLLRLSIVLIALCTSWPATPQAQRSGPTLSADLRAPRARGERIRGIVQGPEPALGSLRSRLRGLLRRDLGGGLALDLSPDELERLSKDGSVSHISGDLPVAADMAITNAVTRASEVWEGSSGLLGLLSSPGYDGTGIG